MGRPISPDGTRYGLLLLFIYMCLFGTNICASTYFHYLASELNRFDWVFISQPPSLTSLRFIKSSILSTCSAWWASLELSTLSLDSPKRNSVGQQNSVSTLGHSYSSILYFSRHHCPLSLPPALLALFVCALRCNAALILFYFHDCEEIEIFVMIYY